MAQLIIDQSKITNKEEFIKLCPFGALTIEGGNVTVGAGCKMCKLCVKKGPAGAATVQEDEVKKIDKSLWRDITVYVDHDEGKIHPVTYELIGKALELAGKIGQKVNCLFMGSDITKEASELLHYGVDKVYIYDLPQLKHYITESYTAVFEDHINMTKPCAILVGATSVGRQLAPRVAARFNTGLTADCTVLDMDENTDLAQIRPAFGGNIMAHIETPNHRPQMATVRYKVMEAPKRNESESGELISCTIAPEKLASRVEVLSVVPKPTQKSIENADCIVVAGRGVKTKEDLELVKKLADALGAELAATRPLIEAGWVEARRQIGLSGRTVRPSLIVTCGVSGAVQFSASMKNSDCIFAINKDESAPIFSIANYGLVGDLYKIIPKLIADIEEGKKNV